MDMFALRRVVDNTPLSKFSFMSDNVRNLYRPISGLIKWSIVLVANLFEFTTEMIKGH